MWKERKAAAPQSLDSEHPRIEGKIVAVEIAPPKSNRSNIITLATDAGEIRIWSSFDLDQKLLRGNEVHPEVKDKNVRITFEGTTDLEPAADGSKRSLKTHKVEIENQ